MSTSINIKLNFSGASTDSQCFSDSVTIDSNPKNTGKRNLAGEMFIELRRATSFLKHHRALPDSGDLLTSSTQFRRTDPMGFVDVFNVPALWLEISNTFRDLRYVLAQAKAYKQLEPPDTTPSTDDLCAYVHFEKMYKLNLAVFDLMKIQDLVVRLLQEAFSGRLIPVDYDDDDWEKKLTMKDALKGLKKLEQQCAISKEECQSVVNALAYPSRSSHRDIVIEYRNRVTHRLRPSVDYRELFTHVQNRAGKPIRDTSGAIKGRSYGIGTGGNEPEFKFDDLYAALSDYMRHVAQMLKHLKSIPRLSGASFGRE